MTTAEMTLDLVRAHQVIAELLVTHGLRVQHLDYHPAVRHDGRTVQLTTVTVGVPSQPAALARWCQVLGITEVAVHRHDRDTELTAEAEHHEIRIRITTYLRGADRHAVHTRVRWHRGRNHQVTNRGTSRVDDLITSLTRAALDAPAT